MSLETIFPSLRFTGGSCLTFCNEATTTMLQRLDKREDCLEKYFGLKDEYTSGSNVAPYHRVAKCHGFGGLIRVKNVGRLG